VTKRKRRSRLACVANDRGGKGRCVLATNIARKEGVGTPLPLLRKTHVLLSQRDLPFPAGENVTFPILPRPSFLSPCRKKKRPVTQASDRESGALCPDRRRKGVRRLKVFRKSTSEHFRRSPLAFQCVLRGGQREEGEETWHSFLRGEWERREDFSAGCA